MRLPFMKRLRSLILFALLIGIFPLISYRYLYTRISPSTLFVSQRLAVEKDFKEATEDYTCVHPKLDLWPWPPDKDSKPGPVSCGTNTDWVYIRKGTLQINTTAIEQHGKITCTYFPVERVDDFSVKHSTANASFSDSYVITSDFSRVSCRAADNSTQESIHCTVASKGDVEKRQEQLFSTSLGLNVLMFGFDSVSRLGWIRQLPQTHGYFTNVLQGFVLEGYNIVGDGTPQALLPILTGHTEPELPEARRGFKGAKTVDGHPWIWKELRRLGYVTQWGEDMSGAGTFTYRMLGFRDPPVDHYMRPFYRFIEKRYKSFRPLCVGSIPRHQNMLNWIRDLYTVYPNKKKFSFLFHAEMSHGDNQRIGRADSDLKQFLEHMKNSGYLNNTLLIMMADHGPRYSRSRRSVQGKYEERMPYFALRFPPWFLKKHPSIAKNLKTNVHRLSTPFDIHETLMETIHFSGGGKGDVSNRGISLLKEIPNQRSCAHADIEPHWCACLKWEKMSVKSAEVQEAASALLGAINNFTQEHRSKCEKLVLFKVLNANRYAPHEQVLKFKQSADNHGRVPDLSDDMTASEILYQITMTTKPSSAIYEATIKYVLKTKRFVVNDKEISRINKYGDQPACVMNELPHLRPFCFCKPIH